MRVVGLLLLLCIALCSAQTTYYASPEGSGDCQNTACDITTATQLLSYGDILSLSDGTYNIASPGLNFTVGASVVGTTNAIVSCAGTGFSGISVNGNSTITGISFINCLDSISVYNQNNHLVNITILRSFNGVNNHGIYLYKFSTLSITGSTINQVRGYGIYAPSGNTVGNVIIDNCVITNCNFGWYGAATVYITNTKATGSVSSALYFLGGYGYLNNFVAVGGSTQVSSMAALDIYNSEFSGGVSTSINSVSGGNLQFSASTSIYNSYIHDMKGNRGYGTCIYFNTAQATYYMENTRVHRCSDTGGNGAGVYIVTSAAISNRLFTFNNVSFINCTTNGNGGAVATHMNAAGTFNNCYFENNVAKATGGAVGFTTTSNFGTQTVTFNNCVFKNNTAPLGGAFYTNMAVSTSYKIANCTFTDNIASQYGGAIYVATATPISIIDSFIINNQDANNTGSAIYNNTILPLTIKNTQIDSNTPLLPLCCSNGDAEGIYTDVQSLVCSYPAVDYFGCNGLYTCQSSFNATIDDCSGHGTCPSPGGICGCENGYTGNNCDSCDVDYIGYPNCVSTATPAPTTPAPTTPAPTTLAPTTPPTTQAPTAPPTTRAPTTPPTTRAPTTLPTTQAPTTQAPTTPTPTPTASTPAPSSTPTPTPADGTPTPTPSDSTPTPTSTPAPTPTPSSTPSDSTPTPTATPVPTPSDSTPTPTPTPNDSTPTPTPVPTTEAPTLSPSTGEPTSTPTPTTPPTTTTGGPTSTPTNTPTGAPTPTPTTTTTTPQPTTTNPTTPTSTTSTTSTPQPTPTTPTRTPTTTPTLTPTPSAPLPGSVVVSVQQQMDGDANTFNTTKYGEVISQQTGSKATVRIVQKKRQAFASFAVEITMIFTQTQAQDKNITALTTTALASPTVATFLEQSNIEVTSSSITVTQTPSTSSTTSSSPTTTSSPTSTTDNGSFVSLAYTMLPSPFILLISVFIAVYIKN